MTVLSLCAQVTPLHALDQLELLQQELLQQELTVGGDPRRDGDVHWMPVLLRCFLSPKPLIVKHRLGRRGFDQVVRQVRADFKSAIASPGDMTGILAACSLGEPCTQLSTHFGCRVQIFPERAGQASYDGAVGAYIDALLAKHPDRVVELGGDSVVMPLSPGEALIVGVSDDEKTS